MLITEGFVETAYYLDGAVEPASCQAPFISAPPLPGQELKTLGARHRYAQPAARGLNSHSHVMQQDRPDRLCVRDGFTVVDASSYGAIALLVR